MKENMNKFSSLAIVGLLILSGCLGIGDDGVIGDNLNPQVVVAVTSGQNVLDLGESIQFDATGSSDEDGSIVSYLWDFGDGTQSTNKLESHKYLNPGEYIISLSVTDDKGAVGNNDKKLTYVTVLHPEVSSSSDLPHALISVRSSVIGAGSEIEFNGEGSWAWYAGSPSTSSVTSWAWDFGDGNTAEGSVVKHTFGSSGGFSSYSSVGNYPVKLTVQSSNGSSDTVYQTIRVLPDEVPSEGSPNPDVLTSVSIGDPVTLDPAEAYDSASGAILTNTYETLVFYDRERTDKLIPVLAEEVPTVTNGGISQDGLTYTFKIRQGVTFHDKSPMDADDVVFSINRLLIIDHPSGPAWMYTEILDKTDADGDGIADSIVKIDQYTVQFQLNQSAPRFLPIMAYNGASILSKQWLTSLGCGVPIPGQECVPITDKVMGTGPYMMNEDYGGKWVREQFVLMQYYPEYWRGWSDAQRSSHGVTVNGFIKTVYLKKNNDQPSRVLELLSGDTDFAYVEPSFREQVVGQPGIEYDEGLKSLSMGFIGFNHDIANYEDTAPSSDFFTNVDIRKGFCYAFDYVTYIDSILDGFGFQPKGPIPEGLLGYDEDGPSYSYNLDMAESHFRDAGVWDDGFTFTAYYNSGNDVRLNALLLLENAIEDMNPKFNMEVQGLEWPDYLDKLRAGELPLFFLGWAPDYADPHNYAQPFLHSDGHFPHYLNFAYDDIDDLIMDAAAEPSESQRKIMYRDLADLEHDKALYIWASQGIGYHFERDWVNGWYHNKMHSTLYYQLSKD
jgi:peptide/nickel transport system substrate-binding protein